MISTANNIEARRAAYAEARDRQRRADAYSAARDAQARSDHAANAVARREAGF
jgi:hypothetical protein